jgi:hypothetical protein
VAEVDRHKDDKGFAATETLLMAALFLGVFIAVLEVSMLCVRGELMSYATARAARVASVYRDDFSDLEAGSILLTTTVDNDENNNVDVRTLTSSYVPFTLTRLNVFGDMETLEHHLNAVPTLPDDISDDELGGDNPLPYCRVTATEIRPCDPS